MIYIKAKYLENLHEYVGDLVEGKPYTEHLKKGEKEPTLYKIPSKWIKEEKK